eukprot:1145905-Pelagomonas_calceolata.AAC.7
MVVGELQPGVALHAADGWDAMKHGKRKARIPDVKLGRSWSLVPLSMLLMGRMLWAAQMYAAGQLYLPAQWLWPPQCFLVAICEEGAASICLTSP